MVLSRKWEVAAWMGWGWGGGVTSCLCDEVGVLLLVLPLQSECYILEGVGVGGSRVVCVMKLVC